MLQERGSEKVRPLQAKRRVQQVFMEKVSYKDEHN